MQPEEGIEEDTKKKLPLASVVASSLQFSFINCTQSLRTATNSQRTCRIVIRQHQSLAITYGAHLFWQVTNILWIRAVRSNIRSRREPSTSNLQKIAHCLLHIGID